MNKIDEKLEELKKQRLALDRLIKEYENRESYYGEHETFRIRLVEYPGNAQYELAMKVPFAKCNKPGYSERLTYRVIFSAPSKNEIRDFVANMHNEIHKLYNALEKQV